MVADLEGGPNMRGAARQVLVEQLLYKPVEGASDDEVARHFKTFAGMERHELEAVLIVESTLPAAREAARRQLRGEGQ